VRVTVALLAAALLSPLEARPQEYPLKPVRFVVPFAQGAGSDVFARMLAQRLSESLAQPVLIENRPGLSGVTGTEAVARSAPDGYTLLQGVESMVINPFLYKLSYDAFKDFTPVSLTTRDPAAIGVHPSVPARTLAELIAYGKANPGELNIGTPSRMVGELFKQATGVDGEIILYKGPSHAVNDTLKGIIHIAVNNLGAFLPYARSERLRMIAVTDSGRYPALPDLPAASETLPGYEGGGWTAVLGPVGLPMGVVSRLNVEIMKAVHGQAMRSRLEASGSIAVGSSPEELAAWMRAGFEKWRRVADAAGIRPE
jgi:tripartite-type tricarboxylate transporter receptor subunit TctC